MKSKVIVLTDVNHFLEPDDRESLVRLFLYSNEIDIKSIIVNTSCWQKHISTRLNRNIIYRIIKSYKRVFQNLITHDKSYPTPDYLHSIVYEGIPKFGHGLNNGFGEVKYDKNPGVQSIIRTVDQSQDSVWILLWSGANTLAQALLLIKKERNEKDFNIFLSKLRIYGISDQDYASHYIRDHFGKDLFYIVSPSPGEGSKFYYHATWPGISGDAFDHGSEDGYKNKGFQGADQYLSGHAFIKEKIKIMGPLGKSYPQYHFLEEGDSPAFMCLINNGLNCPDHIEYGGWGGRYVKYIPDEKYCSRKEQYPIFTNAWDTVCGNDQKEHCSPQASIWRYREDFQNDFLFRLNWSLDSNKNALLCYPRLKYSSFKEIEAESGKEMVVAYSDYIEGDLNDALIDSYIYKEAGDFKGTFQLVKKKKDFHITPEGKGKLHLIIKFSTLGEYKGIKYQRIILNIHD